MGAIKTFRDLVVWQHGKAISVEVYRMTGRMPRTELFGLAGQMRRASVSIPSNIAEGYARRSRAEYLRGLNIAAGSLAELSTQWEIAQELGMVPAGSAIPGRLAELDRMLSSLIAKLRSPKQ